MFDEDSAQLRKQQRFLHEVEVAIRDANRAAIHARIPDLDRQRFVALATFVAQRRADYLAAALDTQQASGDGGHGEAMARLRAHRLDYDEARDAFVALERAVERGYVDIG